MQAFDRKSGNRIEKGMENRFKPNEKASVILSNKFNRKVSEYDVSIGSGPALNVAGVRWYVPAHNLIAFEVKHVFFRVHLILIR